MDRNAAKDYVKEKEPDFLEPAKKKVNGHMTYVCPSCGNGSGKNGDGIALDPHHSAQGKRWKCFKCGLSEDIIGLWKLHQNITDNKTAFEGLYSYFKIDLEAPTAPAPKKESPKTEKPEAPKDYAGYYEKCHSQVSQTDYFKKRGLSDEVIKKYKLGYDPNYFDTVTRYYWYAVIIPVTRSSYIVRNTESNKERYRKEGKNQLYLKGNLWEGTQPVFITEGELDALSIIEAGGEAVALGSTNNSNKLIEALGKKRTEKPIILALDNDEAGQRASKELLGSLQGLGYVVMEYNPYGECKDANEALIEDREGLEKAVKIAIEQADKLKNEELEAAKEEYSKTSAAAYIQDFINGIADSVNTPFIPTGFEELDDILEGGLYEGLYIMGAISSLGKTTLALQMCDQIAAAGNDVLIFSLEMARAELMAKSISRLTLLNIIQNNGSAKDAKTTRGITTGSRWVHYSQKEKDIITSCIQAYSTYAGNIYISEGIGDIGVSYVRETVDKHIRITGKKPVVLIDYVQILAPSDVRASDKQNTDKAVLELKRISRDYKIPVIGISSFNRDNYKNAVTMEAFKESGSLEYGSDVLIGLQLLGAGTKDFNPTEAKQKNPRPIELVVLKNRNGATGNKVSFEYYPLFNYFKEI